VRREARRENWGGKGAWFAERREMVGHTALSEEDCGSWRWIGEAVSGMSEDLGHTSALYAGCNSKQLL